MFASTRFAIVTAVLALAAVGVHAANVTGDVTATIGDYAAGDVVAQSTKAEALVREDDLGLVWVLDNFSHFFIAGPLTFVFHEVVYFSAWAVAAHGSVRVL